ncbi:MFS transporter [Streptomyces sp. NPDC003015]
MTGTPPRTRSSSPLPVYLTSAVLARTADEGARVALVMLATQRADSPALGGALVAALMIPHVAAAPVVGVLADSVRRRRLFHGSAVALYGAALVALAFLVGTVDDVVTLALAAAAGCVAPLLTGGLTGLLAELLSKERLTRAFSADAVSYNLAGICGPAVAAALGTAAGAGAALAVLGAGATAGGLLLFSLRLRPRPRVARRTERGRFRPADLVRGVVEVVRNPPLRSVTWGSSVAQLGVGALPVVSVLLAAEYHAAWAAGGLMTAFAAGALAGSLSYACRPVGRHRPERVVLWGLPTTGIPLAMVPWAGHAVAAAALFAMAGFCTGPLFSALLASRERYAPVPVRTQIFTLGAGLKSTFAAAGAGVAGVLSGLGAVPLMLGAAACQVLAGALALALLTGRRTGPDGTGTGPAEGSPHSSPSVRDTPRRR